MRTIITKLIDFSYFEEQQGKAVYSLIKNDFIQSMVNFVQIASKCKNVRNYNVNYI